MRATTSTRIINMHMISNSFSRRTIKILRTKPTLKLPSSNPGQEKYHKHSKISIREGLHQ